MWFSLINQFDIYQFRQFDFHCEFCEPKLKHIKLKQRSCQDLIFAHFTQNLKAVKLLIIITKANV